MKGTDLVEAYLNGVDISPFLHQAFANNINESIPFECSLGLKANGARFTPRVATLLTRRAESQTAAQAFIKDSYELSDRQSCFMLFDMLNGKEDIREEIESLIFEIKSYTNALGDTCRQNSPEALYNSINAYLFTL